MSDSNYIMNLINRFRPKKSEATCGAPDDTSSKEQCHANSRIDDSIQIDQDEDVNNADKERYHASVFESNASDDSIVNQMNSKMRHVIKTHQIEGITFMLGNIRAGRGCILAHSMGLGKTMQIVGLCDIFLKNSSKTVLILTPVNAIRHFLAEFDYWLPIQPNANFVARNFNVYTVADSNRSLKERYKILSKWTQDGGVLILGYEMFRFFISPKKRPRNESEEDETMQLALKSCLLSSSLVVCDEGHRIKHMDTQTFQTLKQLNTRLRIILTGYPLQNNLNEYFTLIHYAVPFFLGNESEFKILFEKPIIAGQYSDSSPEQVELMRYRTHVLQSKLAPLVHRRCEIILKNTLPQKKEYTLLFKMTSLQKELYEKVLEMTTNNPVNAFSVICKIMNDPNVLFHYLQNDEKKDIDIEDEESANVLYYEELQPIMDGYVPELIENSPKMIVMFQMIDEALLLNEKMVIFSQSLLTLNMIERCLQMKLKFRKNLHYFRIDGSISQLSRQVMVSKFNSNSESKIFLLSTKAGCLVISLVAANRVVLFDASFNPSDDLQAIGRIYRYGQKKNTFIYKFIMDHSLEKSIFEHQIRKQQIAKRIIDEQNPDPYMSLKSALSSYFKQGGNVGTNSDPLHPCHDYDSVLNNILTNFSTLLTEQPILHESLLIDNEDNKLSESECKRAYIDFRAAKHALSPINNDDTVPALPSNGSSFNSDISDDSLSSINNDDTVPALPSNGSSFNSDISDDSLSSINNDDTIPALPSNGSSFNSDISDDSLSSINNDDTIPALPSNGSSFNSDISDDSNSSNSSNGETNHK